MNGAMRFSTKFEEILLSPDEKSFVNGFKKGFEDFDVEYQREDGGYVGSEEDNKGNFLGDIRSAPASPW